MTMNSLRGRRSLILLLYLAAGGVLPTAPGCARQTYHMTLDTSSLEGHPAGPFSLNLQLADGSGNPTSNSTAVVSGISFGPGGGPSGTAIRIGGAAGDLASGVTLTDSAFFNSFTQPFTAGAQLSFDLTLGTIPAPGAEAPDEFSLALLDRTGAEIPTQGMDAVGSDAMVLVDLTSVAHAPASYPGDPRRAPRGGGGAIDIPAIQAESGVRGDINGDGTLNVADAVLVLESIVGLAALTPAQRAAADVNHDAALDVTDAILILRAIVGIAPIP